MSRILLGFILLPFWGNAFGLRTLDSGLRTEDIGLRTLDSGVSGPQSNIQRPQSNIQRPTSSVLSPSTDTIAPTITCPPSATLSLGFAQCDTAYSYTVTVSDDQPNPILIRLSGIVSGGIFSVGATLNNWLVTDQAGNIATCSFTVTVQSPPAPNLICADLITVKLEQNCQASIDLNQALEGGPYGCLQSYLVEVDKTVPLGNGPWLAAPVFTVGDLGKTYQSRITNPISGNRCWGSLTVVDERKPLMSCPTIAVPCAVSNLAPAFLKDSLGLANGMPAFMDECGPVTVTFTDLVSDLPCDSTTNLSGIVTRTWSATDGSGNNSTCQQTINRVRRFTDITIPADISVSCAAPDVSLAKTGEPSVQAGTRKYLLATASYCELEATHTDTMQAICDGTSLLLRTWKIRDLCKPLSAANPFIRVQEITISNAPGPVFECPVQTSVVVTGNTLNCLGSVDLPDFVMTDACSQVTSIQAIWENATGTDTLTGTLADFMGNNPALHDTLGVLGVMDSFPVGSNLIRYVATDQCGSVGTCEFTLQVWDNVPPVAHCDSLLLVAIGPDGQVALPAEVLDNGSMDSCSLLEFRAHRQSVGPCQQANDQWYEKVMFCCSDIGDTIPVVLRVYDVALPAGTVVANYAPNQHSDCTTKIVLHDPLPPTCTAPANVTVTCKDFDPTLAAYGSMIVSASCKVDSFATSSDTTQFSPSCQQGVLLRKFQTFDKNKQPGGSCTQKITVEYEQEYFVKFPNDSLVQVCNNTGIYGEPQFFGLDCEDMDVTFTDEVFTVIPDACYKVERTWKVINKCQYNPAQGLSTIPNPNPSPVPNHPSNLPGPIVSSATATGIWAPTVVSVTPGAPATNYSTFWSVSSNGYLYKQIIKVLDTQDPVLDACPSYILMLRDTTVNDPQLWNEVYWYGTPPGSHDLREIPVDLSMSATDICSGAALDIRYVLFLDTDRNGTQETAVSSTNLPGYNNVNFNNSTNPNFAGGTQSAFDARPVPSSQKYGFAIENQVIGKKRISAVRWNTLQAPLDYQLPQLPHGTHRIRWTVEDGCGNSKTCERTFTISDSPLPQLKCDSALTVHIMPQGFTALTLAAVLPPVLDLPTPPANVTFGIRKGGTGTGFPTNGASVLFNCLELGNRTLEVWARDTSGRTNTCTIPVMVLDTGKYCINPTLKYKVAGTVKNDLGKGVGATTMRLESPWLPAASIIETDTNGHYQFVMTLPAAVGYEVIPERDVAPLNGVTTYDLVLISQHILGLMPIASPYRLIAADANRSGSVTTFDIVEFRKLILGIYTNLPANKSWRFVKKNFVFPDPLNPFKTALPEKITATAILGDSLNQDFTAIKVGDINGSAVVNNLVGTEDRDGEATLFFDLENKTVREGDVVELKLMPSEQVLGYQFTLEHGGLELLDIQPGARLSLDHFGVFADALTVSCDVEAASFAVRFRANRPGSLRDMIRVSDRITRAEAYSSQGAIGKAPVSNIALRFSGQSSSAAAFELFQNQPNPFLDNTLISFYLPQATAALLSVFDGTGRMLFSQKNDFSGGYHTVTVDAAALALPGAGVLYYRLETPTHSAVRKMVRL